MQVPANRHMTDSTENVRQNYFYGFFRGFQQFFKNSWKPVYWTVEGLEKKCENEIRKRDTKIAGVTVWRKMVSFKLAWWVWANVLLLEGSVFYLVHLDRDRKVSAVVDESEPGLVNLDQGPFVRTESVRFVPKSVRSVPPSVSFQCQQLKFFWRIFYG